MSPSSCTQLLLCNVIIVMYSLPAVSVRIPISSTSSSAVDENSFYHLDRQSPNMLQLSPSVEGDVFDRSSRSGSVSSPVGRPVCEPIAVTLCSALRYNATRMPNLVGHATQLDAAEHINAFLPLIQTGCSRLLKFFLCSIYTPMCTEQVDEVLVIAPCRSLCLSVRVGCEPVLARFNLEWPHALDCSKLPDPFTDPQSLCIDVPPEAAASADGTDYEPVPPPPLPPSGAGLWTTDTGVDQIIEQFVGIESDEADEKVSDSVTHNTEWVRLLETFKRHQLHQQLTISSPVTQVNNAIRHDRKQQILGRNQRLTSPVVCTTSHRGRRDNDTSRCEVAVMPLCDSDVMFRSADKRFAEVWMTVWAAVCFTSTLFTVFTFLLDASRTRTPERAIVYISLCHCIYSATLLLRAGLGAESVACFRSPTTSQHQQLEQDAASSASNSDNDENLRLIDGLDGAWCTATFVVGYYFATAAAFWWTVLGLGWYLVATRKWSIESVDSRLGGYIHAVTWSFPAALTIIIVVLRRVGVDELTSTCGVIDVDHEAAYRNRLFVSVKKGGTEAVTSQPSSSGAVSVFVLVPLFVTLLTGVGLLTAGLVSTARIGRQLAQHVGRSASSSVSHLPTASSKTTTASLCHKTPRSGVVIVDGLERLTVRTAVFGLLYAVPQLGVAAFVAYETVAWPSWQNARDERFRAAAAPCLETGAMPASGIASSVELSCSGSPPLSASIPPVEIMLVRLFLQLAVGVASAAWTWSPRAGRLWMKTVAAAARRICCRQRSPPTTDVGKTHHETMGSAMTVGGGSRATSVHLDSVMRTTMNVKRSQQLLQQQQYRIASWGLQHQLIRTNDCTVACI